MNARPQKLRVSSDADDYPAGVVRPVTRGDCKDMPRPCPWVSCSHHLYLDVNDAGALKMNFPDREVWQLRETCSLDVADRGGSTLEIVGAAMNLTRERVRQIEALQMRRLKRSQPHLRLPEELLR